MNEHCSKKPECFAFLGIVAPSGDLSLYLAMAGNARYNWDRVAKKLPIAKLFLLCYDVWALARLGSD
jgi:hypothetical protein